MFEGRVRDGSLEVICARKKTYSYGNGKNTSQQVSYFLCWEGQKGRFLVTNYLWNRLQLWNLSYFVGIAKRLTVSQQNFLLLWQYRVLLNCSLWNYTNAKSYQAWSLLYPTTASLKIWVFYDQGIILRWHTFSAFKTVSETDESLGVTHVF
mgnify:CR=1 FL=1